MRVVSVTMPVVGPEETAAQQNNKTDTKGTDK